MENLRNNFYFFSYYKVYIIDSMVKIFFRITSREGRGGGGGSDR